LWAEAVQEVEEPQVPRLVVEQVVEEAVQLFMWVL
jgi:hypothetical protein